MDILIIEDEPNAARQLKEMIAAYRPLASFGPVIDSLKAAVSYLSSGSPVDLIFLDIHLSDGHALALFDQVDVPCPVIFVTAYDQYAIQAFEVNSLDYLLKPTSEERLSKAIDKFEEYANVRQHRRLDEVDLARLQKLLSGGQNYRKSFLIPYKDKLLPVSVEDFAWFEIQNSIVRGTRFDGVVYTLEERSLDELIKGMDPKHFYRANRQFIINKAALKEVVQYFNGKLLVKMTPAPADKVIISREKVSQFKSWITAY